MMNKLKYLVLYMCFCVLSACNKNEKINVMFGSGVEIFQLDFSREYLTADIFEFKKGISEAKDFGEKYAFHLVEDENYKFSGLIIEAPYFVKREVKETDVKGSNGKETFERVTYVTVIGKMPNDDKWYLVIVDY